MLHTKRLCATWPGKDFIGGSNTKSMSNCLLPNLITLDFARGTIHFDSTKKRMVRLSKVPRALQEDIHRSGFRRYSAFPMVPSL